MISEARRKILLAGIGFALTTSRAIASSLNVSHDENDLHIKKQAFIKASNTHWMAEHQKKAAAVKAAESRGEFASLSPPTALKPFKDWDYYYTQGISVWTPNSGQKYKPVSVPDGFVTDLTSIPQIVWSFGLRPEGPYAYAAIIHDYLYWMQDRSREESDEIFLIAMGDSKVDESLRNRIYTVVRLGGESSWKKNSDLKKKGEKRLLREYPKDFTVSWSEWKSQPGVFWD